MTTTFDGTVAYVEGIAFWTPTLADWETARAVFSEERLPSVVAQKLPSAELLAPAERRRAPDTVVLALHAAAQAVDMSGLQARDLRSVFASAHGDLSVTNAMCQTLARAPAQTSPIRFHHSVHNAASGYWAIATGCRRASTAISAKDFSFANGLMEALCQCTANSEPVLIVGYDIEAVGALASVNASRGSLAVALVISPTRTSRSRYALEWSLVSWASPRKATSATALPADLTHNGLADALPFFEALGGAVSGPLSLPISEGMSLYLGVEDLTLGLVARAQG